jgi:hypothetical protein
MSDIETLRGQTNQNTTDIARLVTTVDQLAHTVERHEKMMVAGFDKLEEALATGMGTVQAQITGHISSVKPPWWQLVLTICSFVSVFGGTLIAFILFLNNVQAAQISDLQSANKTLVVAVSANTAKNEAQDAINAYRKDEIDRLNKRIDDAADRDWEIMKTLVAEANK